MSSDSPQLKSSMEMLGGAVSVLRAGTATALEHTPTDALTVASDGPSDSTTRLSMAESGQILPGLRDLPNDEVTRQVVRLNRKHQLINAELLLYLSELDARKLYRNHACSSLFDFLTTRLGQSEDVAYRWMWGARLLRAFPLAYELLADGRLHLSALMLLKPHLTDGNHQDWLMAAAGKSKGEVEKLVATRCPKADVPTRVRKLPDSPSRRASERVEHPFAGEACGPVLPTSMATSVAATSVAATSVAARTNEAPIDINTQPCFGEPARRRLDPPSRVTKIQPLSEHSYRVVFTASQRLKEKLEQASELASHTMASRDLPALIERALDLLIEREDRRRNGSPRRTITSTPHTKGAERDAGQCTYVDSEGRRCQSRHRLEFDHRMAYALGGQPNASNIRLLCHAHNALAAEQVFGAQRIADAISAASQRGS